MAVTFVDKGPGSNAPYAHDNGGGAQGTGPFDTGTFNIAAGRAILVFALFGLPDPEETNEPNYNLTDIAADPFTFSEITSTIASYTAGDGAAVQAWVAENTTEDAKDVQLRMTHTGLQTYAMSIYVYEINGHNPGDFVGQVATAVNTNAAYDITFASAPEVDALVMSAMMLAGTNGGATTVTIAPDSPWTEQAENVANNSFVRTQVQYGNGQTVERTTATTVGAGFNQRIGVAVEILAATVVTIVETADAVVQGQDISIFENPIFVSPAESVVAGQDITIINPVIEIETASAVVEGQNINLLGGDPSLDLSASLYLALSDDIFITSRLGTFMSPAIFTRRPIPDDATYPMIIAGPPSAIGNEDALVSRRPLIAVDIITYGEQDDQYRVVEELGYYLQQKFHRQKRSLVVNGYSIIDIVASGPFPAPTDDFNHVARAVTLTIRLSED